MHEYSWSLHYVLWELPLAQANGLWVAIAARYDVEVSGPSYADQEILAAMRAAQPERAVGKGGR